MADSVRELAGRISKLEAQVKAISRGRQIAYSSVDVDDGQGGTIGVLIPDAVGAAVNAQALAAQVDAAQQTLADAQTTLDQQLAQAQQDIANAAHVTTSADPPSGTPSEGTIWRQTDSTGIVGQWVFTAGVWSSTPVTSDAIGSVALDKLIVSGTAEMTQAVIDQIYANVITAKLLLAQGVISSSVISDTITAKTITGGSINGASITGNGITAQSGSATVTIANGQIALQPISWSGGTYLLLAYDGLHFSPNIDGAVDGGKSLTLDTTSGHIFVENIPAVSDVNLNVANAYTGNQNGFIGITSSGYLQIIKGLAVCGVVDYIQPLGTTNVEHTVNFPANRFSKPPVVTITPNTGVPANVLYGVSSITRTSVTFWAYRTDTSQNTAFYITAIQDDVGQGQ